MMQPTVAWASIGYIVMLLTKIVSRIKQFGHFISYITKFDIYPTAKFMD